MKFTNSLTATLFLASFYSCSDKNAVTAGPPPPPSADTSSSKVVSWLTTPDQSSLLKRQKAIPFSSASNTGINVDLDTTKTYQAMDGFGYTLTGGSARLINNMSADARNKLLNELFASGESSIGVSYLRLSIGASDLSDSVYTYDDMPLGQTDTQLEHFSLEPDDVHLIPVLKQILAISGDIKIIATPWTPPVWMKDNGSSKGGSLKPEFYGAYANYFVKYIQAMKAEGIAITAITPQNEPLHPENNPSLLMHAEQQAEFIKNHLGPAFQEAGLTTKIVVYDHNADKPDYPLAILNDAAAKAYVDGSAFHLYAGDISALSQVYNAHPDRNIYFTEQYTSSTGQFGGDLQWHLKNLIIGAPRNWSKTVFQWNLANDVVFGPYTPGGCTTCKGALTIDGSAVVRNVSYYIIAHASKFVPAGSVRIESNNTGSIRNVAFKTPAGQKVVIALNEGSSDAVFNIRYNGKAASTSLPAGAVGTYVVY